MFTYFIILYAFKEKCRWPCEKTLKLIRNLIRNFNKKRPFSFIILAKIKKITNLYCWRRIWEMGTIVETVNCQSFFLVGNFLECIKRKMYQMCPFWRNNSNLMCYPKYWHVQKKYLYKNTHRNIVSKVDYLKQPKYLSISGWINKLWYVPTYYSAIKKNKSGI